MPEIVEPDLQSRSLHYLDEVVRHGAGIERSAIRVAEHKVIKGGQPADCLLLPLPMLSQVDGKLGCHCYSAPAMLGLGFLELDPAPALVQNLADRYACHEEIDVPPPKGPRISFLRSPVEIAVYITG